MSLIKTKEINYDHVVKNVALVLIINNDNTYPSEDAPFDITKLKFLALKNAINNWQRDARQNSFYPKVIIGYNK